MTCLLLECKYHIRVPPFVVEKSVIYFPCMTCAPTCHSTWSLSALAFLSLAYMLVITAGLLSQAIKGNWRLQLMMMMQAPANTNRRHSSIPRLQDPSSQAKRRPSQVHGFSLNVDEPALFLLLPDGLSISASHNPLSLQPCAFQPMQATLPPAVNIHQAAGTRSASMARYICVS